MKAARRCFSLHLRPSSLFLFPMFPQLALRILRTTDPRLLGKFMWNFGVKGLLSIEKFKRRYTKKPAAKPDAKSEAKPAK